MKAAFDVRLKLVLLYSEGVKTASELRLAYGVPERTLRRWKKAYQDGGGACALQACCKALPPPAENRVGRPYRAVETEAPLMGRQANQAPVRPAGALGYRAPRSQEARLAGTHQSQTATLQAIQTTSR